MTIDITYNPVYPDDIVQKSIFNNIKDDLERGITEKLSISNPIFNNIINITETVSGNVSNVADAVENNDAINVSQNNRGNDHTGIDIGNILLFHGNSNNVPQGFEVYNELDSLADGVIYIIRTF